MRGKIGSLSVSAAAAVLIYAAATNRQGNFQGP
jgi:tRNA G18 (ribose-2'-O)-methylase SpoU